MNARDLIAWNMRRLRVDRGFSQERLALDSGVDRTYVSRLERGIENPTVAVIEKLSTTLGVPIAQLFEEPAPDQPLPKPLRAGRKRKA